MCFDEIRKGGNLYTLPSRRFIYKSEKCFVEKALWGRMRHWGVVYEWKDVSGSLLGVENIPH